MDIAERIFWKIKKSYSKHNVIPFRWERTLFLSERGIAEVTFHTAQVSVKDIYRNVCISSDTLERFLDVF